MSNHRTLFRSRRLSMLLTLLAALCQTSMAQLAVGKWRDHLSYSNTNHVAAAGDRIYCSADKGMFYYDLDDRTVNRMNKTTMLNDVGISTFAYDAQTHYLVVAYSNSNIDIIKDDKAYNIGDLRRSDIGGSKRINNISFRNRCAYLACAFGVVVVDMSRDEIKETYYLGPDGTYLNINDLTFTDSLIVVATDNGIMTANKDNRFLHLVHNWTRDTLSLLAGQRITQLATDDNGRLLALACNPLGDTTLYREVAPLSFAPLASGNLRSFDFSSHHLMLCHADRLEVYDNTYSMQQTLTGIDWMDMDINHATMTADGRLWLAHSWASMVMVGADRQTVTSLTPGGPWSDDVYRLTAFDDRLIVSPGGHLTTFANAYIAANAYTLQGDRWLMLSDPDGILASASDVIDIAVNPKRQKQLLAACWGSGLLEINDNKVTALHDETNTDGALTPYTQGAFSSLRTGAVAFDNKGNAWVTNSRSPNVLAVRRSNGSWEAFNTLSLNANNEIDHIIWDSIGDLKLFWGRENKIFVHDGDSHMAYIDPNNGAKLSTSMVNTVVQDHDGHLWIGTNKGIKVAYDLSRAFAGGGTGERSGITCNNILFSQNGISEYLMAYESVTCMAVDGANRKWVGTSTGGLYLISANGLEEVAHFTTANSPLFSDKILAVAVMPWTGEVFIATDKGLQSFRGTATYAFTEPMEDIHAFPNPVRPDFDGLIAIKGFTRNAIVHITDAAGNTVYATRANGGQAVWNGCTQSGQRVASGVYYVFASAEDGSMRSATKIMIIR